MKTDLLKIDQPGYNKRLPVDKKLIRSIYRDKAATKTELMKIFSLKDYKELNAILNEDYSKYLIAAVIVVYVLAGLGIVYQVAL